MPKTSYLLQTARVYGPNFNSFDVIGSLPKTTEFGEITGSAIALRCCKAHANINRKMGNSTPCTIVTSENFILKLCTRDYVGAITHDANFRCNRYSGGFFPNRLNITTL